MSRRPQPRKASASAKPAAAPIAGFLREVDPWLELPLAACLFLGTWLAAEDTEVAGGWFDFALCAIASLAGLLACLGRKRTPVLPLLGWPLAAWVAWSLLSTIATADTGYSLTAMSRMLAGVACFTVPLVFAARDRQAAALRLALVVVAAGTFSAALGLKQWLANVVFQSAPDWRTFGTFNSPNSFAGYLVLAIPVGAALLLGARDAAWRVLGGFALLLMLAALALTQSKAGLLAFALSAFVFVLLVLPGSPRRRVTVGVALVVGLGLAVAVVPPVRARFLGALGAQSHSTMFRVYCWEAALSSIRERPLLGWGPGAYPIAHLANAQVGYTTHAHSDLLQVATESGIPAALAALATLGMAIGCAVRGVAAAPGGTRETLLARGIGAGLVGLLAHGLMDCNWTNRPTFGAVMLLLAALHALRETSTPAQPPTLRRRAAAALLLAMGLCPACVAFLSTRSLTLAREAGLAQRSGLTAVAIGRYEEASRLWPLDATALRRRLILSDDRASVKTGLAEVVRRNPWRAMHWLSEGDYLLATGDPAAAEAAYREATRRAPLLVPARIGLAACAQARRDDEAVRREMEGIAALEAAPYGRYPAVPERASLEFVYPAVVLAELAGGGPAYDAGLERVRGYLAQYETQRAALSKSVEGNRELTELLLRNAGLSSARENQARILLARLLWLDAQRDQDPATSKRLLREAERAEGPATRQMEAGKWRGSLIETAIYRAEGGL